MLIDSHCHLDFPDLVGQLPGVVARAHAAGLKVVLSGEWAPELLALGDDVCTRRFAVTAWTDTPFPELGDAPDVPAPERECTVLSWDRDAHVVVTIDDVPRMGTVTLSVATSCLYTIRGRRGDVPCLPAGTLAELPREPLRAWRRPVL